MIEISEILKDGITVKDVLENLKKREKDVYKRQGLFCKSVILAKKTKKVYTFEAL